MSSAIPSQTRLVSLDVTGTTAIVDLNSAFGDLGGAQQILAVAQIVYTLTETPAITAVRFAINDTPIDVPDGSGLQAAVLDHYLVQITADRAPDGPVSLTYTVSNGAASATGEIVVLPVPAAGSSQAPVVDNVEVSVRTGGVVTVDVLDTAYDPDGDALTLVRDLPEPLAAGQGLLFVSGLTRSMQFTTLATIAYAEVPQDKMNGANTLQNVVQPIGFAFGIAVAALGIRVGVLLFPSSGAAITMSQFHVAFVIIGVIALIAVFDTLGLAAGTGDDLRKKRAPRAKQPALQGE